MESVAETYVTSAELVCQHIKDPAKKANMLNQLKNTALEHAKMELEFDAKCKALEFVGKKLKQVPDLEIEKVIIFYSNFVGDKLFIQFITAI